MQLSNHSLSDHLTDFLCVSSLIGLWARLIETNWLDVQKREINVHGLPNTLDGFSFVHLSDLHLSPRTPKRLIKRVQEALEELKPRCIVFTGDFICYAKLQEADRLESILKGWRSVAPIFACLGNHDYERYVTQRDGSAKVKDKTGPFILRALKRLFFERSHPPAHAHPDQKLLINQDLLKLLQRCDITLLEDAGHRLSVKGSHLLFWGLRDLWSGGGKCVKLPASALDDISLPIILAHNPDHIDQLDLATPSLVLSGHTHGGNINLPWIRSRIRSVYHADRLRGHQQIGPHQLYINRGLSDPYPLRLFSRPELTYLTLKALPPSATGFL